MKILPKEVDFGVDIAVFSETKKKGSGRKNLVIMFVCGVAYRATRGFCFDKKPIEEECKELGLC